MNSQRWQDLMSESESEDGSLCWRLGLRMRIEVDYYIHSIVSKRMDDEGSVVTYCVWE